MSDRRIVYRVCPFCEATCGLSVEVAGNSIVSVRGDKEDPFSHGYICPKAHGLKELHDDRDRLRSPVRRTANGWEEITWDEAYAEIAARMLEINQHTSAVAASVEQQNAATGEISHNVASAAEGTGHVVAVLGAVAGAATETRASAEVVRDASQTVEIAVANLRLEVEDFLAKVAV